MTPGRAADRSVTRAYAVPMSPQSRRAASRRAEDPILLLLILGTVIAVACAFGPVWFARAGLVVAVVTAVVVWWSLVRTIRSLRITHALELSEQQRRAAEAMRRERARERATLDTVNRRMDELDALIVTLRTDLDATVKELDEAYATIVVRDTEIGRQRTRALQAEKQVAARQDDIAAREAEIRRLSATLQRYESELAELHGESISGEVVGLPRRRAEEDTVALPTMRRA